ncbi:MAG: tRNA (guanosine(37)-N1)-methyltransferase TrmD [Clostridiales Family XIII bacterium]|jgi:tRNA (guanine37-N1)-methyltransferase|nr:tRNA (guanosine(37)-N1)-methyltransferase TrmD [Clostridiales Family XIII bacterium]
MKIDILTLFPEMFAPMISSGVIGRAAEHGLLEFRVTDIRDHTEDKHRKVDDYPFGGGAGQLMTPQPIFTALRALGIEPQDKGSGALSPCAKPRLLYPSPRGRLLDQALAEELAAEPALVLLCGRYEGIDQRVLDAFAFEEVSIGDYVLTGGEIPAMAIVDTVTRLVLGVLGSDESHAEESVYSGLLEYPQYTRPASFEDVGVQMDVPEVLLSGNHRHIELWNFEQSLRLTAERRPDLLRTWLTAHYHGLDKQKRKLAEAYLERK